MDGKIQGEYEKWKLLGLRTESWGTPTFNNLSDCNNGGYIDLYNFIVLYTCLSLKKKVHI